MKIWQLVGHEPVHLVKQGFEFWQILLEQVTHLELVDESNKSFESFLLIVEEQIQECC